MGYDDIKLALSLRLREGLAPTAIVASPTTAEILSAVETALDAGFLSKVLLVGDPDRIPAGRIAHDNRIRVKEAKSDQAVLAQVADQLLQGDNRIVIKGNISSGKLLHTVLSAGSGKQGRLSHIYVIDSKSFPDRAIIFSDAGVNIDPDLETKVQIVENAIRFAHRIGYERPRVALLSAVETVNPAMPSTIDAAALRVMGDRGRFAGCEIDGPMAIDAAMAASSAATKSLSGAVAGRADILICPDIDSANCTAKALIGATGRAMGVIFGGTGVPVAFPSRGDSEQTRLDSILLAASLACSATTVAGAIG